MAVSPKERREQSSVQAREHSERGECEDEVEDEKRKGQIDNYEGEDSMTWAVGAEPEQKKKKRKDKKRKNGGALRSMGHNQWEDKCREEQGTDGARRED